jgi:hypothetical protein
LVILTRLTTTTTVFNLLLLVYSVIQIAEIRGKAGTIVDAASQQAVTILTALIPCVIALAQVVYVALAWKIYEEFGWKVRDCLSLTTAVYQ